MAFVALFQILSESFHYMEIHHLLHWLDLSIFNPISEPDMWLFRGDLLILYTYWISMNVLICDLKIAWSSRRPYLTVSDHDTMA